MSLFNIPVSNKESEIAILICNVLPFMSFLGQDTFSTWQTQNPKLKKWCPLKVMDEIKMCILDQIREKNVFVAS